MTKNEMTPLDFEVNAIYSVANALDLMIRDTERKMRKRGEEWKYEKKQALNRFLANIKQACTINEQLISQEIINVEANNDYRGYEIWQEEANAFARFILLLADRMTSKEAGDVIQKVLEELPGDGLCTKELLAPFYLKK